MHSGRFLPANQTPVWSAASLTSPFPPVWRLRAAGELKGEKHSSDTEWCLWWSHGVTASLHVFFSLVMKWFHWFYCVRMECSSDRNGLFYHSKLVTEVALICPETNFIQLFFHKPSCSLFAPHHFLFHSQVTVYSLMFTCSWRRCCFCSSTSSGARPWIRGRSPQRSKLCSLETTRKCLKVAAAPRPPRAARWLSAAAVRADVTAAPSAPSAPDTSCFLWSMTTSSHTFSSACPPSDVASLQTETTLASSCQSCFKAKMAFERNQTGRCFCRFHWRTFLHKPDR